MNLNNKPKRPKWGEFVHLHNDNIIDRNLLTRKQHENLLSTPRPEFGPAPAPPRGKKTPCKFPNIWPPRIDQLALPTIKAMEGVLEHFNQTLEPMRIVRLVKLIHTKETERPLFTAQPPRKRELAKKKKKKKKRDKKKECLKVWLKKQSRKSSRLIVNTLRGKKATVPNYRQLLVALGLMKAMKLKKKKHLPRYTKQYLMKICEQMAIICDTEWTPYKRIPEVPEAVPLEAVESVVSRRHVFWKMRPVEEEEELEIEIEAEEEEEEIEVEEEGEAVVVKGERVSIKAEVPSITEMAEEELSYEYPDYERELEKELEGYDEGKEAEGAADFTTSKGREEQKIKQEPTDFDEETAQGEKEAPGEENIQGGEEALGDREEALGGGEEALGGEARQGEEEEGKSARVDITEEQVKVKEEMGAEEKVQVKEEEKEEKSRDKEDDRAEEKSIAKEGEEKSLSKEGEEKSLAKEAEEKSLAKGEEKSVSKEGEEKSLAKEGEEKSLAKEGEEKPLVKEGEEKSLAKEGEEKPLVKEGEEKSLAKEGEQKSLAKEGEEKLKDKEKDRAQEQAEGIKEEQKPEVEKEDRAEEKSLAKEEEKKLPDEKESEKGEVSTIRTEREEEGEAPTTEEMTEEIEGGVKSEGGVTTEEGEPDTVAPEDTDFEPLTDEEGLPEIKEEIITGEIEEEILEEGEEEGVGEEEEGVTEEEEEERLEEEEIEEELPEKKEEEEAPPTELIEEHPPGTVSYLSWNIYSHWLEEFGRNIQTYGKCLSSFKTILEADSRVEGDKIRIILVNWGTYLKESMQFEKNMADYFKDKKMTKCAKCGDYTLYNIPEDHEIPDELKQAATSTGRWKKLLEEAEELCRSFSVVAEDAVSLISHESVDITDSNVPSSDTSMYVVEDYFPSRR